MKLTFKASFPKDSVGADQGLIVTRGSSIDTVVGTPVVMTRCELMHFRDCDREKEALLT